MSISDLWTPTGVVLGFQMTLFSWRLAREVEIGDKGDIPWLTPSDYMNIVGMLILVFGVYLLPIMNIVNLDISTILFGLGIFLFIGQALGIAGHYQLFNTKKKREFMWFPKQEKNVLLIATIVSLSYLIIALIKIY